MGVNHVKLTKCTDALVLNSRLPNIYRTGLKNGAGHYLCDNAQNSGQIQGCNGYRFEQIDNPQLEGPAGEVGERMIAIKSLREQKVVMDDYTESPSLSPSPSPNIYR
jgi:hypothetical protein